MFVPRTVTVQDLQPRLAALAGAAPSASGEVDAPPRGAAVHVDERVVGTGEAAFGRLAQALSSWDLHREAGMVVAATGDAAPGVTVVNAAAAGPLRVLVPCRVVSLVDEPGRRGFVYATLPGNPVRGVERFTAQLAGDGAVTLCVRSWSRAAGPARLFPPALRLGQRLGNRRYLAAAQRLLTPRT